MRSPSPTALRTESTVTRGAIAYTLIRSARRKRTISLTIDDAGRVRIAAPLRATQAEIDALIARRAAWIEARLRDHAALPSFTYRDGDLIPFAGEHLVLHLAIDAHSPARVSREGNNLRVALATPADAVAVHAAVTAWCIAEARRILPAAVRAREALVGATPRAVFVRHQKTRWGSCAPDGTLRFNWRLVLARPALLDYVVVHELAHLHHRNHGPRFWAEVARVLPDVDALRRELRLAGPALRLPPPPPC